ncbi:calcium-activated chloride channel regulator 3A-1-like [Dermacentor andersoni]|uniref:calcium-activated chloride channel regulator 3A-1-like n=1 Tax=Dermacentor andersoni TaxID=34620 RepID=UPI003B3A3C14
MVERTCLRKKKRAPRSLYPVSRSRLSAAAASCCRPACPATALQARTSLDRLPHDQLVAVVGSSSGPTELLSAGMRLATMVMVTVTLFWTPCGRGVRLNRANGAYEDIVVAIHPAVEPDERIIENIKALFRSASSLLLRATGGLVHFGSVVIAVPATWPPRPQTADAATGNLFATADVRVAAENPQYGDAPYTLQPRGCGERGEYIHLAPRFLAEMNGSIAEIYGDPAYRLVHEWAHYRYGVFDEHGEPGSSRYPSLYCESGTVRATMCSSEPVNFTVYMDFGEPCRVYQGCRVSSQCKVMFWRDGRGSDRAASSIMSMPHFVEGVNKFCDDSRRKHDPFAPNKHNVLCERRSTWEVISANEDFTNLPHGDSEKDVHVTFREVQKQNDTIGMIIFALDVSTSMRDHGRIGHLKAAATHFVEVLIPDDLKVGVVTFNTAAHKPFPLTTVSAQTRERIVNIVRDLVPGGSTCIGCALRKALEEFRRNAHRVEGSVIVLMTDGGETSAPYMADVLADLVAAGVRINTIALGKDAERKLEVLALRTGGKPFALRDGSSNEAAVALESAFLDSTVALLDHDKRPIVVRLTFLMTLVHTVCRVHALLDHDKRPIVVRLTFLMTLVHTVCRVHALLDHDKRPIVVRLTFLMTLIFAETAKVPKEGVAFSVLVDRDLGKGTTVTLSCDGTCALKIELRYPDGRKCNECLTTQSTKAGVYITIRIPGTATPGTWTLVVSLNPGSREVQVHVRATSFVVDATVEPVLVRSFVKRTEVNVATDAVVYAEVSKGTRLVLHARVTATVIRPRSPDGIEVELHDNGLGADVTANDGIYSGYFTWFDGVGRYSVSTRVASVDRTVFVSRRMASGGWPVTTLSSGARDLVGLGKPDRGTSGAEHCNEIDTRVECPLFFFLLSVSSKAFVGRASAIPTAGQATGIPFSHFVYVDQNIEEAERRFVSTDKAPGFVRYAEGGSFRLNIDINPYDIPPGSVQDLTVENALVKEDGAHVVFLAWTCPGSHLYWLNASHVELRVSSRPGDLVGNFSSALRIVVPAEVGGSIDGNVRAGAVGLRQRLRIHLPDALLLHRAGNEPLTPDLYVAVTVWNDRGVSSSVSNVARVTFRRPPPIAVSSPSETALLVTVLTCLAVVTTVVMVARRRFAKLVNCC